MGISRKNPVIANNASVLGDWHANLFYIDRKKNVIFCNDKTLYSVVAFQVNREQIKNLEGLLKHELGKILIEDGLEGKLIQKLVEEIKDVSFAQTNNRPIVGVMVDHVKSIRYDLYYGDWEWKEEQFRETVKRLNRTPMMSPKFVFAIELLGELLGVEIDKKIK